MPLTTQLLCVSPSVFQFKLLYWNKCWMNRVKKSSFQSTLKRTTYVFCFFFCSYSCLCFYLLVPVPLNLHLSWQSASQSPYIESKCKCIINQAAGNVFALLRITYQSILILLSSFPCVLKCQWAHYIEIQEVISLW